VCDYIFERIKRETRKKTVMQSAYLLVKGLIKKKSNNNKLFVMLDDLFEIPKEKKKPQRSEEELISDFENYIKGV
jgi:sulfur relay (sulfurtransferase) complex TusBCD TusD component (DsrE family)